MEIIMNSYTLIAVSIAMLLVALVQCFCIWALYKGIVIFEQTWERVEMLMDKLLQRLAEKGE